MNSSSGISAIRWVMVAVGLVLGVALISRGSVLIGGLVTVLAVLRAVMLLAMHRRQAAWSKGAATPGRAGGAGGAAAGSRSARLEQLGRREVGIAAAAIGVGVDELQREMGGGRSIADVARSRGVAPDTVVNAIVIDAAAVIDRVGRGGRRAGRQGAAGRPRLQTWATTFVNRAGAGLTGEPRP